MMRPLGPTRQRSTSTSIENSDEQQVRCYAPSTLRGPSRVRGPIEMQPTWSQLLTAVSAVAVCVFTSGCETPVNDVDLPPPVVVDPGDTSETERAEDAASTPTSDEDTASTATSIADATDASSPVADDAIQADVSTTDTTQGPCDASEACLAYWVALSECSVAAAGPDTAIDPSTYDVNCAATCDLAERLDYVGHYACLSAGIPDDCTVDPVDVPDCDI